MAYYGGTMLSVEYRLTKAANTAQLIVQES